MNVDGILVGMTDDHRNEPDATTVPVGESVVRRNVGYAPDTVTAYEGALPSSETHFAGGDFTSEAAARNGTSAGDGVLRRGDEEHTFEVPGTYAFYCVLHEQAGVTGVITVEGPAEAEKGGT